ncbi:MAG: DUF917 domain-containing protein [Chloroflexi bacterium]|nr:DUF917 domain-containing protein [Chloroflexota bacterium]
MLREIKWADLEPLAIGAGILGTGGGGNPYLGKLQLRELLKQKGKQDVIAPDELADEALTMVVGSIGAPTVGIEKLPEGTEMKRAIRALEKHLGQRFDAVAIAEIGGSNSINPLIAGVQLGIPTVDSDGMGRAFPEIQMSSFSFNGGIPVTPLAMADCRFAEVIVPKAADEFWAERIARNLATSMGARSGLAGVAMTGRQLKDHGVHYTLSLAHALGCRVLAGRDANEDIPTIVAEVLAGEVLLRGKVVDVFRRTTRGFARGWVKIDDFAERERLQIEFQNEYLIATINDEVRVTVPDMICIIEDETGEPVPTELLRFGTRVAVLAVPGAAQLKTEAGLQVVGPRAFGYDVDFQALPGGVVGERPPVAQHM